MMKIYCLYSVIFIFFVKWFLHPVEGLNCWTCENKSSNKDCNLHGTMQHCMANQQACENEVRRDSNGLRIFKRCKEPLACSNNQLQNSRAAWLPSQCNWKVPNSVCRCCCFSDLCNAQTLNCLQSAPLCDHVKPPHFGKIRCNSNKVTPGVTCNFGCRRGFKLQGKKRSTCVMDVRTKETKLSRPMPRCQPIKRKILCYNQHTNPLNGAIRCSNGNKAGSVCTFTCNKGYLLQGNRQSTCGSDKNWNNDPPTCIPATCQPPHDNLVNGQAYCSDDNQLGSVCEFLCNPGYFLDGFSDSICEERLDDSDKGSWDQPSPVCRKINCSSSPVYLINGKVLCSDGDNLGSECRFECNSSFSLRGPSALTCQVENEENRRANWNDALPICVKIICLPLQPNPANGFVSCTNENNEGSTCSFTCNPNFAIIGSRETTCIAEGNDGNVGTWTFPPAVCEPITCTPSFVDFENIAVECSNEDKVGSVCYFVCNLPLTVMIGSYVLTCQDDGDGDAIGAWSSPLPSCERQQCSDPPPPPENGFIVCDKSNYLESTCEYGCDPYYTRVGPLWTNCLEEEGEAYWDNPAPICQPNKCPLQELPHGEVTCDGDGTSATTNCSFRCVDENYQLLPEGTTTNVCLNNTKWSESTPCCTRLCPPHNAMDLAIAMDSSSTIGVHNWLIMKEFVKNILEAFILSPDDARMSLFRYNNGVDEETQILFNEFPTNKDGLLEAFDNIPYDGAGTFTGNALQHARDIIFNEANGDRPNVRDIMLVITDGRSQDDVTSVSADLRKRGIVTFALSIVPPRDSIAQDQILDIAGSLETIIHPEGGFQGLTDHFSTEVSKQFCGEPCI